MTTDERSRDYYNLTFFRSFYHFCSQKLIIGHVYISSVRVDLIQHVFALPQTSITRILSHNQLSFPDIVLLVQKKIHYTEETEGTEKEEDSVNGF